MSTTRNYELEAMHLLRTRKTFGKVTMPELRALTAYLSTAGFELNIYPISDRKINEIIGRKA